MKSFTYERAHSPAEAASGRRAHRRRQIHRRRHQSARPDEARDRDALASDRRQRSRRSTRSKRRPTAACASARWCATPTLPPTNACAAITVCCRARCSPAPRDSCATRRRPPATCCSGRAVRISTTPTSRATNASPAAAAPRSAASAASIAVHRHERRLHRHPSERYGGGDDGARRNGRDCATRRHGARTFRSPISTACPATRRISKPCSTPGELITAVTLPKPARRHAHLSQGTRPRVLRVRAGLRRRHRAARRHWPRCARRRRAQAVACRRPPKRRCRAAPRRSRRRCSPTPSRRNENAFKLPLVERTLARGAGAKRGRKP